MDSGVPTRVFQRLLGSPHNEQHRQRDEDAREYEQGEQPAAEHPGVEEVARDRLSERGQRISHSVVATATYCASPSHTTRYR